MVRLPRWKFLAIFNIQGKGKLMHNERQREIIAFWNRFILILHCFGNSASNNSLIENQFKNNNKSKII